MAADFLLPGSVYIWRRRLPHWEVSGARYFVTVRSADSLPPAALLRIQEVENRMRAIPARDPALLVEQRRLFALLERYLDAGHGRCFLNRRDIAELVAFELEGLSECGVTVRHYSLMPNHWHAILDFVKGCDLSLADVMKRVKGRTGFKIRKLVGGKGAVWQQEWFDRWIRNAGEFERFKRYIGNNPTKAFLPAGATAHAFTK